MKLYRSSDVQQRPLTNLNLASSENKVDVKGQAVRPVAGLFKKEKVHSDLFRTAWVHQLYRSAHWSAVGNVSKGPFIDRPQTDFARGAHALALG